LTEKPLLSRGCFRSSPDVNFSHRRRSLKYFVSRFSRFLFLFWILFWTLFSPWFFSGFARAQSTPHEPEVSTDELIQRALQSNLQPAIARAKLEAARHRAGALKALPNPVLQITPGFSGSEEARDEEIIVSQTLDLFGQRKSQRKVLDAQARAAAVESTLVTRALVIEVKNAAAELFAAQEVESLSLAQVEITQAFLNAARRRAELGDIPPVQVQRVELEL
jgi:cobalt-zinc-cadmium efflux system outer membrane protein